MPWRGKKDVERHNKRCAQYPACVKLWLRVANKHYKKTGDDGQAVIRANVAAKKWMESRKKSKKLRRRNPWWLFTREETLPPVVEAPSKPLKKTNKPAKKSKCESVKVGKGMSVTDAKKIVMAYTRMMHRRAKRRGRK